MDEEKRLYDAAVDGNAEILEQLLQHDRLILDKATLRCSDRTHLHIAAMLGHVNFVKAILDVSSDMCLARDRDGRNPLHIAAIKGRQEVLKVLIESRPLAAREKTDGGGTILHLCVKYNQPETLKMLVEYVKDPEFLNTKNDEGMTILHLAVLDKQIEIQTIQFLVENQIDVNAKNAYGKTSLDILAGDANSEICIFLQKNGALRAEEMTKSKGSEWLDKRRDAILIVATLIATFAFQAGLNPAGGVWQEDLFAAPPGSPPPQLIPHRAGEAIMAHHHKNYYRYYIRANTIAFVSSLSTILLLISGLPLKRRFFVWILMVIMWLTITSVALTYGISIMMVTPKHYRKTLGHVIYTAVTVWCIVMSLLLLGNTVRLARRWGIKKWKSRSGKSAVKDHNRSGEKVSVRID